MKETPSMKETSNMSKASFTQHEIEQFLYLEAELLDEWRLPDWSELYTKDAAYEVACPNDDEPRTASPATTLFLVSDRKDRIVGRAVRLMKKTAHAEYPHSKTRHLVTNVRVLESSDQEVKVRANFCVFRTKEEHTVTYMGEFFYTLVREEDKIRIRHKRAILDLNSLYQQGRLTIIL
jgi:p-cumate 2,3-dioxygenase subunit beta